MIGKQSLVTLALFLAVAVCGVANAFYFDIWPATSDGSQNAHSEEGYAIAGEGNFRFTKSYHHMTYMGFGPDSWATYQGYSDGPDGIPQGRQKGGVNDSNDGVLMADWLVGKKAFHASIYVRNSTTSTCDPYAADGVYLNDPVQITGFRVANDGAFRDRGTDATGALMAGGYVGCCAGYLDALLDGGESAPPAWRIGKPYVDRAGVMGYSQIGDINTADPQAEFYKASMVDTLYAGQEVKVGSAGFGTTGYQGFATNVPGLSGAGRFAFDYVLEKSDAMMRNSATITEADCTGFAGEEEPRDFDGDLNYGEGWFAEIIDRPIIQGIAFDPECKGLVFDSIGSLITPELNTAIFGRDQGGGMSGAYLAITATLDGDGINNDGCVDVVDLLDLVDAFGSAVGDPNFQPEVDWNSDGFIDVVDLLTLVGNFGLCVP